MTTRRQAGPRPAAGTRKPGGTRKPPTPPPVPPPTAPVVSAVVKTPSQTNCGIAWHVDQFAQGWVEYGTTTAYGHETVHETSYLYQDHSQTLPNASGEADLLPGTLYHFRIHAINASLQESITVDDTFTTAAAPPSGLYPPVVTVNAYIAPGSVPALPALKVLTADTNAAGQTIHLTRIDNGGGTYGSGGHDYASKTPWNADMSMFWDHYVAQLLDATTWAVLGNRSASSDGHWAWTDRVRYYDLWSDGTFGFWNMVTGAWTTLYNFNMATYSSIYMGQWEGSQSRDDRYFGFQANRGSNSAIMVLDRKTGGVNDSVSMVSERHDFTLGSLQGGKMSPSGTYVVWMTGSGYTIFLRDAGLTTRRVLGIGNPHADVGYDKNHNEIIVASEAFPSNDFNVRSHRLDQTTSALDVGNLFPTQSIALQQSHISLQSRDLDGWALVTSFSQQYLDRGRGRIIAVPTDGSAAATGAGCRDFGWHYSDDTDAQRTAPGQQQNAYGRAPFGCPNHDGTKVAIHSRRLWSGVTTGNSYGFVYQL